MSIAHISTENGHQVVRLPDEVHIEGDEVSVKRVGRSVLLVPADSDRWGMLVASLDEFTDDYMQDRAQPANADPRPPIE